MDKMMNLQRNIPLSSVKRVRVFCLNVFVLQSALVAALTGFVCSSVVRTRFTVETHFQGHKGPVSLPLCGITAHLGLQVAQSTLLTLSNSTSQWYNFPLEMILKHCHPTWIGSPLGVTQLALLLKNSFQHQNTAPAKGCYIITMSYHPSRRRSASRKCSYP